MPKALVHVKILDAASARPEAAIEELAADVDGASMELVERVLQEYGDPATSESTIEQDFAATDDSRGERVPEPSNERESEEAMDTEQTDASATTEPAEEHEPTEEMERTTMTTSDADAGLEDADASQSGQSESVTAPSTDDVEPVESTPTGGHDTESIALERLPDLDRLSSKQVKVLRAIRERPHATQAELAELFDVSRATISQRANGIEGFDWMNRREIVDAMFDDTEPLADGDGRYDVFEELATNIDDLAERVSALERSVDEASKNRRSAFEDPELTGTVVRACIDSDAVTEDEEIRIIAELIEAGRS